MIPSTTLESYTVEDSIAAPTIKTLTSTGSQGGGVSSKNRGKGAANKAKSTSKKSGKKGTKPKVWDNSYDKLYNLVEKTNEALRRREKIERDYDRLLKNRNMTASQLLANSLKQIANLREEIALQEQLRAGRLSQARNIGAETFRGKDDVEKTFSQWGVTRYASLNTATGRITIDWEGIEKITDVDKGGAVEAYISRLEEVRDQLTSIDKTIENAVDAIHEIKKQNQGDYLNFEQFVHDALVQLEQTFIDEARDLADTISSANAKILNSLRESIQLERQIRDNTKAEEDIADKEMRLAFLRRDTSGANALEIKQLEEEIISAREAYEDALIDQELDKLARINEDANEQRSRQIEIMQQQLEYNKSIGHYWGKTYELLRESINADGSMKMDSSLMTLLQETEGFKGMSELGQMKWIDELVEKFAISQQGYASLKVEQAENRGKVILGSGQTLTYDKKTGRWLDSEGGSYGDLNYDPVRDTYSASGYKAKPAPAPSKPAPAPSKPASAPSKPAPAPAPSKPATSSKPVLKRGSKGEAVKELQRKLGITADGSFGAETEKWVKDFQEIAGIAVDGRVGPATWKALENWGYLKTLKEQSVRKTGYPGIYAYAKGGLVTHTGPAWLDGTKSDPEAVLDAQDTRNFIQLLDVLESLRSGDSMTNTRSSVNHFDIRILVDEIASDYDIERVAKEVKKQIAKEASDGSVNLLSRKR